MANKLVAVRIKQQNGQYSNEIPVGAWAENVAYNNTTTVKEQLDALIEYYDAIGSDIATAVDDWMKAQPSYNPQNDLDTELVSDEKAAQGLAVQKLIAIDETPVGGTKLKLETPKQGDKELEILTPADIDTTLSIEGMVADAKTIGDAIKNMATEFDETQSYEIGDCCIKDNILQVAKIATAANDGWIAARWQQITVMGIINGKIENLKTQVNALNGDQYYTVTKLDAPETHNGATVSYEDGKLKFYGTSNAIRRWLYLNGQHQTATTSTEFSQTLPKGTYKFSVKISNASISGRIYLQYTTSTFNEAHGINITNYFVTDVPVMIGLCIPSNINFGTQENPTYVDIGIVKYSEKADLEYVDEKFDEFNNVTETVSDLMEGKTGIEYSEEYVKYSSDTKREYIPDGSNSSTIYPTFSITDNIMTIDGSYDDISVRHWFRISGSLQRTTSGNTSRGWDKTAPMVNGHVYSVAFEKISGSITIPDDGDFIVQMIDNNGVVVKEVPLDTKDYIKWRGDAGVFVLRAQSTVQCSNFVCYFTVKDVTNIQEQILPLDIYINTQEQTYPLDNYWIDEINTSIKQIRENVVKAAIQSTSMLIVTDCHWSENAQKSPSIAKILLDKCPFNYFVGLGDYVAQAASTEDWSADKVYAEAYNCMTSFQGFALPFLSIRGNHDSRAGMGNLNRSNLAYKHWVIDSNKYTTYGGKYYFYEAITWEDLYYRYICIDYMKGDTTNRTYKGNQIAPDWIGNVFDTDKPCVILTHAVYKNPETNVLEPLWLLPALEPYKDKIVCILCGHAHKDALKWAFNYSVPIIVLDQDQLQSDSTIGTITEQSLAAVTIERNKISVVKIGRGSDFVVTPETQEFVS